LGMTASDELKNDLREGRIDANRLVDMLMTVQHALQAAQQRIAELEKQLAAATPPPKVDEPFSMRAEEKRQEARGSNKRKRHRQGRRGRLTTADKLQHAERTEETFPEGVALRNYPKTEVPVLWGQELE
jgi:transposase